MARLIYSMIVSLDGYVADEHGSFDWAEPDEEVHRFANELERPVGTYLYGRRMYETMAWWESPEPEEGPDYVREYAEIWRAGEKVVYSSTLSAVSSSRTRIERAFDPDAVRRMKAEEPRDISISGPSLAAHAIEAGLVDVFGLIIVPVVVGSGLSMFPPGPLLPLRLEEERRFSNGWLYLQYRPR